MYLTNVSETHEFSHFAGTWDLGLGAPVAMLFSLYVINKAGGLIYQQDLSAAAPRLSSNDHLRLGSTFHSMHAIAALVRSHFALITVSFSKPTWRFSC